MSLASLDVQVGVGARKVQQWPWHVARAYKLPSVKTHGGRGHGTSANDESLSKPKPHPNGHLRVSCGDDRVGSWSSEHV